MDARQIEHTDYDPRLLRLLKVLAVIASVGAINWGLVGFLNYNLVDALLGGGAVEQTSLASRILYALVGLSGLGVLLLLPSTKRSTIGPDHTHSPRGFMH